MDDVKTNAEAPTSAPVETETTAPDTQQVEQTAAKSAPMVETPQERMIPYTRFSEVNAKWKEAQRKLAEAEQSRRYTEYDPNDVNAILAHPIVQELLIKQAKSELTDYAKGVLEQYPSLHPQVKKAILSNVRGFVKESTTDVESAKIDIAEYIDSIIEEQAQPQAQAQPKNFPVASTNPPTVSKSVRPADIQKILEKPLDDWSEADQKKVEEYSKNLPQ